MAHGIDCTLYHTILYLHHIDRLTTAVVNLETFAVSSFARIQSIDISSRCNLEIICYLL